MNPYHNKTLPLKLVATKIRLIAASVTLISLCYQMEISHRKNDEETKLAIKETSNIIKEIIDNLISTTPLSTDDVFFILNKM